MRKTIFHNFSTCGTPAINCHYMMKYPNCTTTCSIYICWTPNWHWLTHRPRISYLLYTYRGLRTNWLTNVSGSGLRVGVIHKLKWLLANVFTNKACDSDLVSGGREIGFNVQGQFYLHGCRRLGEYVL